MARRNMLYVDLVLDPEQPREIERGQHRAGLFAFGHQHPDRRVAIDVVDDLRHGEELAHGGRILDRQGIELVSALHLRQADAVARRRQVFVAQEIAQCRAGDGGIVDHDERLWRLAAVRVGDVVCARAFQAAVGCVNADSGRLLWTKNFGGREGIAADAQSLYAADGTDRITAWAAATGEVLWTSDAYRYRSLSTPFSLGPAPRVF